MCDECGIDLNTNEPIYCSPECRLADRMGEPEPVYEWDMHADVIDLADYA